MSSSRRFRIAKVLIDECNLFFHAYGHCLANDWDTYWEIIGNSETGNWKVWSSGREINQKLSRLPLNS